MEGAFEVAIGNLKIIASFSQVNNHLGIVYNITPNTYRDIYNAVKQIITIENVNIDYVVFQRIVPIGRALNNMDWSLRKQYISEILTQMEQIEKELSIDVYSEDSFPLCIVLELILKSDMFFIKGAFKHDRINYELKNIWSLFFFINKSEMFHSKKIPNKYNLW